MNSNKEDKKCCLPSRDVTRPPENAAELPITRGSFNPEVRLIPGGDGLLGTHNPFIKQDGESPCRKLKLKPFSIMTTCVTNTMFERFIEETGYVTEAERIGWSFVFYSHVPGNIRESQAVANAQWWRRIDGATWRHINGSGSKTSWHDDHPVVQISWNDANAFAKWAGGRLPNEKEWEHAARGGLGDVKFPWGDQEPDDIDFQPCNIWQGQFPKTNTIADGYEATAPAKSFEPNGYGLYNLSGNVWEWTSEPFKVRSISKAARDHQKNMYGMKLLKGGSFLCHKSYCFRYRIASRTGTTPDSTTSHQGFRLVFDTPSNQLK